MKAKENNIEFIKDEEIATVSFTQRRYKTRIKKLAASRPDECKIIAENKDGSLCAQVPTTWIKIAPPRSISEKQIEAARERIIQYHENK